MGQRITARGKNPVFLRFGKLSHPALGDAHVRVERAGAVETGQQGESHNIDRSAWPRRPRVQRAIARSVTAHRHAYLDAWIDVVSYPRGAREVIDPVLRGFHAKNACALFQWISGRNQIIRLQPSRDAIDVLETRQSVGLA